MDKPVASIHRNPIFIGKIGERNGTVWETNLFPLSNSQNESQEEESTDG